MTQEKLIIKTSTISDGPMNLTGHEEFDRSRRANREAFLMRNFDKGNEYSVIPSPNHGTKIEIVEKSNYNPRIPLKADGLITGMYGLILTMTGADCPSLTLYDPVNDVVGLAHIGWKNLSLGFASDMVNKMVKEFNCDQKDLLVFIGPGICGSCFEIGPEVAKLFGWNIKGKVIFNLQLEIENQLKHTGVHSFNIHHSSACTKHGSEFFSFRRGNGDPTCNHMTAVMMK